MTKLDVIKIALNSIKIAMDNANADKKSYETLNKAVCIFDNVKNTSEFKSFIKYRFEKHSSSYDINDTCSPFEQMEIISFIMDIVKEFDEKEKEIIEKENKESLKKDKVKEIAGEGFWNGKIYGSSKTGYSIYVANKKYTITDEDYLILK